MKNIKNKTSNKKAGVKSNSKKKAPPVLQHPSVIPEGPHLDLTKPSNVLLLQKLQKNSSLAKKILLHSLPPRTSVMAASIVVFIGLAVMQTGLWQPNFAEAAAPKITSSTSSSFNQLPLFSLGNNIKTSWSELSNISYDAAEKFLTGQVKSLNQQFVAPVEIFDNLEAGIRQFSFVQANLLAEKLDSTLQSADDFHTGTLAFFHNQPTILTTQLTWPGKILATLSSETGQQVTNLTDAVFGPANSLPPTFLTYQDSVSIPHFRPIKSNTKEQGQVLGADTTNNN